MNKVSIIYEAALADCLDMESTSFLSRLVKALIAFDFQSSAKEKNDHYKP